MMTEVVTLDVEKGKELGLREADLVLLTETGLPRRAGGHFSTELPDGPLGLFAVVPMAEGKHSLILGGPHPDGDMVYFLDVDNGAVVLVDLDGGDEGPRFEIVNTSLASFAEFVQRLGAYADAPPAARPADDKARLAEIAASHAEAFDRALDRLEEKGWHHVTGEGFASATGQWGLLALPDDFTDAFSADGTLLRDVDVRWRGGLPSDLQSAFAWEGLVLRLPEEEPEEEPEDDPEDFDAAMDRLMAAAHGPSEPDEGIVTCLSAGEPSDLCRILRAFDLLAAKGYVAEPALWPTTSGCWERVAERSQDPESPKAVFWNTQSHDSAFDVRGDLVGRLHLGWAGDPGEIGTALAGTGLTVRVPQDKGTTFILGPA